MEQLTLNVAGMSCSHCVARVTSALNGIPGVDVKSVDIGSATVEYNPSVLSPQKIADAVTEAGYDATPSAAATET